MKPSSSLREKGFQVYASSHALSGAERGITGKFGGVAPVEIIAHTLRFFGQGMKVCVEIAAMAADGGFIPPNVPILSIGGTGRGADTAVIMRAAHANHISGYIRSIKFYANPYSLKFPFDPNKKEKKHSVFSLFLFLTKYLDTSRCVIAYDRLVKGGIFYENRKGSQ